jgi:DNA polymerase
VARYIIDTETGNPIKNLLKEAGAAVYLDHPLTDIICLVWKQEGEGHPHDVWSPWLPETAEGLARLRELAEDQTAIFVSHAMFEQYMWRFILEPMGLPPMPPHRWEDTQAAAAWRSCPLALEKLCKALHLPIEKDMEGSRFTIALSRPNKKTGMLDRSQASIERAIAYCKTDVDGEEATLGYLGDLSPAERKVWLLDQDINHRGVKLDLDFVHAAQQVVDRATVPLLEELHELTGGINPAQTDKLKQWCAGQGVELENLQKGYLAELLGTEENDDGEYESLADLDGGAVAVPAANLPTDVRRVLEIRGMLGSASIKKLGRMLRCVGADGRARGLLQYHAAHPGRWSGRLLQPQNFPRGVGFDADKAVAAILTGDPGIVEHTIGLPAIEAIGHSLRHALVPAEGHVFEVGDYAGIEMCVDLALAGQYDKCDLLATGADVYLDMANQIYNRNDLTKADIPERTIGKNTVLGCGFQMGAAKFHERYCSQQPFWFAEQVVETYRTQWAPKVVELWAALKEAVGVCVRWGRTIEVYGCRFRMAGDFMAIDLPSGWQTLWFYGPHMREREDWGECPAYWAMKNGRWTRVSLYGGLLCENIVQALARGILCEAMGRLNYREKQPIVLSVHDEAIAEVPEDRADIARFQSVMEERSPWIERLKIPIAVEAWSGYRYKK